MKERKIQKRSSVKIVSKEKLARGFGNVCEKVRYMKFIGKIFIELNCTEKKYKINNQYYQQSTK